MICQNCGETGSGNYCSHCGHRMAASRLDWTWVWHYIKDSFDIGTGFLRTIRLLMSTPGKSLRSFIDRKDIDLSNPLKVLFLTGTVATLITAKTWDTDQDLAFWEDMNVKDVMSYFKYSTKYFSFFSLDALPVFALFSWLIFRSPKYNYLEHLLLNAYILGGQFLLVVLLFPLTLFKIPELSMLYGAINVFYNIWVLQGVFNIQKYKWIIAIIAVAIPQILMPVLNYFVYRIAPSEFWTFLDLIFD